MRRAAFFAAACAGLAAMVETVAAASAAGADARRPNILFIAVDDLRPAIGAYGDARAVTPNIDRLAASGSVFLRAYCQQAVCSPSRISLLTGLRPDTTGIYDLETHHRDRVSAELAVLPEYFRAQGYQTVGRGKIFHGKLDDPRAWDSPPSDFSRLGSPYALPENRKPPAGESGRGAKRGPAWEKADVPDETYADGRLAGDAADYLRHRRPADRPFFLAVGFLKPHLPFNAPAKYWELHDPARLPAPFAPAASADAPAWVSQPGWELRANYTGMPADNATPVPEETARLLRHGYYAAVSYVDAQIGKVLDALEETGLADNTVVVLWGDHGFHLGDHGTWCKHTNFEIAVHAPLILRAPGRGEGARVTATVELLDVYPTLVELAGLPAPSHLEGRSLAPFLDDPSRRADRPAFSQYPRGDAGSADRVMGYSVATEKWRYTEWLRLEDGRVAWRELYDLTAGPDAARDLAREPAFAPVVAEHSALLAGAGVKVRELRGRAASVQP